MAIASVPQRPERAPPAAPAATARMSTELALAAADAGIAATLAARKWPEKLAFGTDKVAHFTVSALVVVGAVVFFDRVGLGPLSPVLAMAAALGLGYAKELWDEKYGSKVFSREDLMADALGAASAMAAILLGTVV